MAKVTTQTKKIIEKVTLELTEDEAQALLATLGGMCTSGGVTILMDVYNALANADVSTGKYILMNDQRSAYLKRR